MIKIFENFQIRNIYESIDKTLIDPYGEENWGDEKKDFSNSPGRCIDCGSRNLKYIDTDHGEDYTSYEYRCKDCGADGREIYLLIFNVNERI
jgi:DNA-directed RNA polymerase subunit RPC12/RpoP